MDQVVRDNQLARCPFARSGRADLLLHERHPELAQDIDEERHRRVKAMAYKAAQKDDEKKMSSSFKTRLGSLEDMSGVSPTPERRRKAKAGRNEPFSPELRARDSQADLMFAMDDEGSPGIASPLSPCPRPLDSSTREELDHLPTLSESWNDEKGKASLDAGASVASPSYLGSKARGPSIRRVSSGGSPWASAALPTAKLGLREILAESKTSQSALSEGLAADRKEAAKAAAPKMSQKERKKFLQQQAEEAARHEVQTAQQKQAPWTQVGDQKGSPWQSTPAPPKSSVKDAMSSDARASLAPPGAKPLVAAETANTPIPRRAASPDTRFSGQNRSGTATPRGGGTARKDSGATTAKTATQPQASPNQARGSKPLVPHSKSYIQRPSPHAESLIGLGLADIIGQQRREQEIVKEAVAKRSLQEIQQEQAFQEWWDQESRRAQEEEAQRTARDKGRDEKKAGGGGRRRGGRVGGGGGKQKEAAPALAPAPGRGGAGAGAAVSRADAGTVPAPTANVRGRGRGRGRRGGKAQ